MYLWIISSFHYCMKSIIFTRNKKKLPFQFSHCSKSPFFVQKSLTFYRLGWVEFYRYQKSNSRNEFSDQNWTFNTVCFQRFMDFLTPDLLLHFSSKMESKLLANKYGNNTIIFNTTRKLSVNEIATSRNGKKNLDQRYYQFVLHFYILQVLRFLHTVLNPHILNINPKMVIYLLSRFPFVLCCILWITLMHSESLWSCFILESLFMTFEKSIDLYDYIQFNTTFHEYSNLHAIYDRR